MESMSDSKISKLVDQSVNVSVPAVREGASEILAHTLRFAKLVGLVGRDRYRLGIVVEELVRNVIEHGDPRSGSRVDVTLIQAETGIEIHITDKGRAFDPRTTLDRSEGAVTAQPEKGSAVGWPLINLWCRIEQYDRESDTNRLRLLMSSDTNV